MYKNQIPQSFNFQSNCREILLKKYYHPCENKSTFKICKYCRQIALKHKYLHKEVINRPHFFENWNEPKKILKKHVSFYDFLASPSLWINTSEITKRRLGTRETKDQRRRLRPKLTICTSGEVRSRGMQRRTRSFRWVPMRRVARLSAPKLKTSNGIFRD